MFRRDSIVILFLFYSANYFKAQWIKPQNTKLGKNDLDVSSFWANQYLAPFFAFPLTLSFFSSRKSCFKYSFEKTFNIPFFHEKKKTPQKQNNVFSFSYHLNHIPTVLLLRQIFWKKRDGSAKDFKNVTLDQLNSKCITTNTAYPLNFVPIKLHSYEIQNIYKKIWPAGMVS